MGSDNFDVSGYELNVDFSKYAQHLVENKAEYSEKGLNAAIIMDRLQEEYQIENTNVESIKGDLDHLVDEGVLSREYDHMNKGDVVYCLNESVDYSRNLFDETKELGGEELLVRNGEEVVGFVGGHPKVDQDFLLRPIAKMTMDNIESVSEFEQKVSG